MKTWLKNPLVTWTANEHDAAGGVVIENDVILELVSGAEPVGAYDNTLDVSDCVLLPGLINCHHHFYQTLTRAFGPALNKELFEWLTTLYPYWAGLDEECIRVSTTTAIAELWLSGCTTAADHHYVFSNDLTNAIDVQAQTATELGARVVLTRGSMSLGESDGGLPPDKVVQDAETILRDSQRLVDEYHDNNMIQVALAPCSPFSVTTELMRDSARLARELGVLLHTHLAETEDENDFCIDMFGKRPLDYLEEVEWLTGDVWLAHGIHFEDSEIQRLGAAGTAISHCPSSNMVLASGICRTKELTAAGCPVGLGVDGSASNDASNLIQEARQALMAGRLRYGSKSVTHEDVFHLGTTGGAALLHREDIGQIAVGKKADLALFDLNDIRFAGAGDPLAALIMCGAVRARHVMVSGEWKVKDGELTGVDEAAFIAEQKAVARRLTG